MSLVSAAEADRLKQAVHRARLSSKEGLLERLFTLAFRSLVYPQIWEDPEVDMAALAMTAESRVITIASGGCNVLAYLTANPSEVVAVDLNAAHIALTRLKVAAARLLPNHETFFRFFGAANAKTNIDAYDAFLRTRIDSETRDYWETRGLFGRRRISLFSRNIYKHGLLGRFVGFGHLLAKGYGINLQRLLAASSLEEQRAWFKRVVAPLFDKRLVRWAASMKPGLYALGIPPAQYDALAACGADMATVLRTRLERLACAFPLSDNYFAWQAFGRRYPNEGEGPLPPYLRREHFESIRDRADRVTVVHQSFTERLEREPAESFDRFVLLDAQDWMTDAQMNCLWAEITRTARRGARVIFRTAGEASVVEGRVSSEILAHWRYAKETSRTLAAADRSSVYGGFHLYVLGR